MSAGMRALGSGLVVLLALGLRPALAREPDGGAGDGAAEPAGGAGEKAPESDEEARVRAQARVHYVRGKKLHDAGDYDRAAEEYLAAFQLYPHPLLLYDVAQVKRLAGDREEALTYYRKYLHLAPEGKLAARARRFAAQLDADLAAGRASEQGGEKGEAGGAASPEGPDRGGAAHAEEADGAGPHEGTLGGSGPSPVQGPERDRGSPGRIKRIAGLAVAGVGLVSIGFGVKYGLDARRLSDRASRLRGTYDPAMDDRIYEDGRAADRNMLVFGGAGLLALAGGGALYYLGVRDTRVAPAAGGGQAGVVVSGRF